MRQTIAVIALLLLLLLPGAGVAQRRITPVTPASPSQTQTAPGEQPVDKSRLVTVTDSKGNTVQVDTVTGREYVDSTLLRKPPRMEYPLLYAVNVGVNFWDPLMRAFGQKYGLGDVWAELNMHNRYFPIFVAGVGNISDTPANKNYTFRTPVAPYFKIGASYNFFYNSNPDYLLKGGLRYGFSSFKWSVTDVTVDEGYWDEPTHFNLNDLSHTSGWIEVTFGVQVKLWRNLSAGWTIVYHSVLHDSKSPHGEPMYIPGYGKRSSALTGNFSLIYTLPLKQKPRPAGSNIEGPALLETQSDAADF